MSDGRTSAGAPACTHCRVPMNLCHCSKSCCSACGLGATTGCACIARAPPPPKACGKCAEHEKAAEATSKLLNAKDRELAELKKKLADARSSAQSEREARANLEAKHAMHVAALEKQLNAALAAPQSAPREAELERTAAQARKACWEAEARAKSSDATCIKLRDELAECKLRLVGIEDEGRLAAEMRLAHVAEAAEMHAVEASLRRELEAAQSESSAAREASEAAKAEAKSASTRLSETVAELARCQASKAELEAQTARLSQAKESALAYEGAVAESRRLKALLSDANAASKALQSRNAELEGRVEVLTTERSQLAANLAHAERIKELFSQVTSRTNQVQEAANEVIEKVAARKKAAAQAERAAAAPEEEVLPPRPKSSRPATSGSQSARAPLQRKQSHGPPIQTPWPPTAPPGGARAGFWSCWSATRVWGQMSPAGFHAGCHCSVLRDPEMSVCQTHTFLA